MDTQTLQDFILALETSGLPANRRAYWIQKFTSSEPNPSDEEVFIAEMTQHTQMLDSSIEYVEGAIALDETRLRELKIQSLPYLERLSSEQETFQANDYKAYTSEILVAEHLMMASLEGVRKTGETDEIAALKAKLMNKKP